MSYTVVILIATTIFGCHSQTTVQQLGKSIEKFTGELYKQYFNFNQDSLVFSGLSVDEIFSLVSDGAKGNTKNEIIDSLSLPKNDEDRRNAFKSLTISLNKTSIGQKILTANKLYPADSFPLLESYKNIAINNYGADIENLDYSNVDLALNTINQWVEQKTNNKIKNILSSNDVKPLTKLILVNTLYFSGNWSHRLHTSGKGVFSTSNTKSKEVDYMEATLRAKFRHCGYFKAKFLELAFEGSQTSMTFILPDNISGLALLEKKMDEVLEIHNMTEGYGFVQLPKFKTETTINLIPILEKLGISTIFGEKADLSLISSKIGLYVNTVIQKAFIAVDENGVEAAAATVVAGVGATAAVQQGFDFRADHSFLYYIRETTTGAVLFVGKFQG